MADRDPRSFDQTRPLVMAEFATVGGHNLPVGTPLVVVDEPEAAGEVDAELAIRLWMGGRAMYAEDLRPTPVETPEQSVERLTTVEELGGERFLVNAPWLQSGEIVAGPEAADARVAEVKQEGLEVYANAAKEGGDVVASLVIAGSDFEITEAGSNGYYEITGPGMDEPEKVRGHANAEARLVELRTQHAAKVAAENADVSTANVAATGGGDDAAPVTE